jgi:hypothetical protein
MKWFKINYPEWGDWSHRDSHTGMARYMCRSAVMVDRLVVYVTVEWIQAQFLWSYTKSEKSITNAEQLLAGLMVRDLRRKILCCLKNRSYSPPPSHVTNIWWPLIYPVVQIPSTIDYVRNRNRFPADMLCAYAAWRISCDATITWVAYT